MKLTDINNYLDFKKEIFNINPIFKINFDENFYQATADYDDTEFCVRLLQKDLKHIDIDCCYFDVQILLLDKLNNEIDQYIKTYSKDNI